MSAAIDITVLMITSRGLHAWHDAPLGTYDLLAAALRAQTRRDGWELVVVDKHNPLPRPELRWLGDRVRFLRPRPTPWTERGWFAAAAARNSGLAHARGRTVLALDDGWEPSPRLLEAVADRAARGEHVVPQLRGLGDGRPQRFRAPGLADDLPAGILAFPLDVAVRVNGFCERYDGCSGYEDVDFSRRMTLAGVRWWREDPDAYVVGHKHEPRLAQPRCGLLHWLLAEERRAAGGPRALLGCEPWSAAELAALATCGRQLDRPVCHRTVREHPGVGRYGGQCDYDEELDFGTDESARARAVRVAFRRPSDFVQHVQRTYESRPWFDLAAERARAGAPTVR